MVIPSIKAGRRGDQERWLTIRRPITAATTSALAMAITTARIGDRGDAPGGGGDATGCDAAGGVATCALRNWFAIRIARVLRSTSSSCTSSWPASGGGANASGGGANASGGGANASGLTDDRCAGLRRLGVPTSSSLASCEMSIAGSAGSAGSAAPHRAHTPARVASGAAG